ncbi:MAG: DUF932 domain-containing protein, partial [Cyclobacteriaceae bacterium]
MSPRNFVHTSHYSFISIADKPWRQLGPFLAYYTSTREAITDARLNYKISQQSRQNNSTKNKKRNQLKQIYQFTACPNTGKIIGTVPDNYQVSQNEDAFVFLDSIAKRENIYYETAGTLNNGERMFIMARLPGDIRLINCTETLEKYLLLTTSLKHPGRIKICFIPIRNASNNTLNVALGNNNCFKVHHSIKGREDVKNAYKVLRFANDLAEKSEMILSQWTRIKITDKQVRKLIYIALSPEDPSALSA